VCDVPIAPALHERVHTLVADYLGGQPLPDDLVADPVAMQAGTAVVYLRLLDAEPPVVRIFSPLLRDLDVSGALLAELNELNARLTFDRLFWRDRAVYAATERLAETLTATELRHAIDSLADHADYYDVRLHDRFGGVIAFADNRENSR
jgi:hypothetical protein